MAQPELSPAGGDATTRFDVTISCPTAGAVIHYTLNGEEPTQFHPTIISGESIPVNTSVTVKAKAWVGATPSALASAEYRLTGDVSAGALHAMALTWEGQSWAWGAQGSGRLGNYLTAAANVLSPTASNYFMQPVSNGARVAAGSTHSVILSNDRKVWAFGDNSDGALGDSWNVTRGYAAEVVVNDTTRPPLTDCVSIGAGLSFSTALSASGNVYAWGLRTAGRLGDGQNSGSRRFASKVQRGDDPGFPDLSGIVGLATGQAHSLAREKHAFEISGGTGRLWSWGNNASGQLGRGNTTNLTRAQPVMLDASNALTDVWDASAGEQHSAVVRWKTGDANLQGTVWCFGERQYGRLGNNVLTAANVTYPVQVLRADNLAPLANITSVACGSSHTLALDDLGKVWAWGYNGYGALGNGNLTNQATAVRVQKSAGVDLDRIVRIGAGGDGTGNFSMAIDEDGKIYVWGRNANGQLGNGTTSSGGTLYPVVVPNITMLPLNPQVSLSYVINESSAPGQVTVTASPTHGPSYGSAMFDRVDIYIDGQHKGSCVAPNWTLSVSNLTAQVHHVYGVAHDFPGNSAMSPSSSFTIGSAPGGGPNDDPDGDGLTNAEEALLGTNPGSASFTGTPGSEQYSYDALDRVTGVSGARTHSYQYDKAGNIESAQ